jgi:hypothetical protein
MMQEPTKLDKFLARLDEAIHPEDAVSALIVLFVVAILAIFY